MEHITLYEHWITKKEIDHVTDAATATVISYSVATFFIGLIPKRANGLF